MSGTISASDQRNVMLNSFVDAYENQDKEKALSIFDENAEFYVNDAKLTPEQVVDAFMTGHEYFDDIKNVDRNTTTMFYNSGDIYTNYWYTWNGTNKKTGETLVLRGYAWFKWDGLKVIEAYNAFDPTAIKVLNKKLFIQMLGLIKCFHRQLLLKKPIIQM